MEYRMPNPGETVHCWEGGENYLAHQHMLYLGPDKNAKDNILVQNKKYGWKIISLSELPVGKFRSIGRYNLENTFKEGDQVTGYVYRFFDHGKSIPITIKLMDGVWKMKKDFKAPSWMEVESKPEKKRKKKEVSNS